MPRRGFFSGLAVLSRRRRGAFARIPRVFVFVYHSNMKFAIVTLPDHAECEFLIKPGEKRLRVLVIGRGKQLAVLAMLLLCASALFATTRVASTEAGFASATPSPALVEFQAPVGPPVEQRTVASHFDGLRTLKVGDLVIMDGTTAPKVRQIAGAPNQTVLLRRGNSLHALYLVGDNGYVVVVDNESRLVHSAQIRATVAPVTLVSSF